MTAGLLSTETIRQHREVAFRQRPELRISNDKDAEAFIDTVGICLFQPNRGVVLPSLWQAVAGTTGPAPRWGEHDRDYLQAWNWKDSIFSSGSVFYGKALGTYRLFISRSLLPYFYAASDLNYGGEETDYLELYQDGKLSLDARNIYEAILEHGVSSTTMLRRFSRLDGKGQASRKFERALTELQRAFMICAVGIAQDNAWKYTFRYNTVIQQFPAEVLKSRSASSREALAAITHHYVALVGSSSVSYTARLFGWDLNRLRRVAATLNGEKRVILSDDGQTLISGLLS